MRHLLPVIILISGALFIIVSCGGQGDDGGPPWPSDYGLVFTKVWSDPAGDFELRAGAPTYIYPYHPIDVTQVSMGVWEDYLYVRLDFDGVIPTSPVHIVQDPPVEEQTVVDQQTNVAIDCDGNQTTGFSMEGINGADIMFGVRFVYGRDRIVFALMDFSNDPDNAVTQINGHLGPGGPGHSSVTVRYAIAKLPGYWTSGAYGDLGGWSEASSEDLSGSELYHHFAFDQITSTSWTVP